MKTYDTQLSKLTLIIITTLILIPKSIYAEDVSFIPRAWVGVADYEYKQESYEVDLEEIMNIPDNE